jgi:hypothetical protein
MNESTTGFGDGASLPIGATLGNMEWGSVTGGKGAILFLLGDVQK